MTALKSLCQRRSALHLTAIWNWVGMTRTVLNFAALGLGINVVAETVA